jgi:hypothetical protein
MRPARFLIAAIVVLSGLLFVVPGSQGDSPKSAAAANSKAASTNIEFNRDIRPILSKNCFVCHGADEGNRKVKLRLDVREEATKLRKKGKAAIQPGHPEKSLVIKKITAGEMPPEESGNKLTPDQIETIKRWVQEGAPYAEHWAFVKPKRPALPPHPSPSPPGGEGRGEGAWPRNALDYFILARLEKEALKPSPEADRLLLLRRASLDLRGLPPSPDEVEAFAKDTSPNAYEKMIDRFLADPAFGERWARVWLDLARYADSAGYGSDPLRPNMWPYRDWVINAFNRNLPYDEFTIEQLAGDLLPKASGASLTLRVSVPSTPTRSVSEDSGAMQEKIATAFHRNTMTNTEGGTDPEEYRVAAVKDRAITTMQVWMGLTMGCAQCHSHKYDPISHKDFYSFFAVFNQTADANRGDEAPTLPTPTRQQLEENRRIDARVAEFRQKLEQSTPALTAAQVRWEEELRSTPDWKSTRTIPLIFGYHMPFFNLLRFRLAMTEDARIGKRAGVPAETLAILDRPDQERKPAERDTLARYFRSITPLLKDVRDEIAKVEKSRPAITNLPVMQELPAEKHRITHLMKKGNFLDPGEMVPPATPAAFPRLPEGARPDRLGMARWLVGSDNPLTARVAVNRYWARLFGAGIVETEEDFGTQGELPSHPELLDWLAIEYRDGLHWDTKALLKMIVTSAAYRQTSRVTPELLARDPRNRLLSRGPRYRLEAETIRDQAMALSGLLAHKIGGPSVYPPQPDGLWQAAFNGERTWATSKGEDRYRRGLYTFWRRTIPYPSMAAFDAPSRETCAIKRVRSNTPVQAFVTLNDPVYVEAAQALARRILREGCSNPEDRARFVLRLCLVRTPEPEQVAKLLELYQSELEHYSQTPAEAMKLATDPLGPLPSGMQADELAAWTVIANVVLNLDGVLTKG